MLIESLCAQLGTTRELCSKLDAAIWQEPSNVFTSSTPGSQVRHLLDLVRVLLDAIEQSKPVRYDQRARGDVIERSGPAAIVAIDDLLARLARLPVDVERPISVCETFGDREVEMTSTIAREISFVANHACHHHALLRFQLASRVVFDGRFGVARETPSP